MHRASAFFLATKLQHSSVVALPKGYPRKLAIASRLRTETPFTPMWMAMGSASYLSALLKSRVDDSKL